MSTNSDWQAFTAEATWSMDGRGSAEIGETRPWARGEVDGMPALSALLSSSRVTPITVDLAAYELLAWDTPGGTCGWLCLEPSPGNLAEDTCLPPGLGAFWHVSGGIVERFGEPDTWWLNQNEVLTKSAVALSLADVVSDYAWLWQDNGLEIPIDAVEYCVVAVEANGNLTLAHRRSGQLVLFAPDHSFADVTPFPGCPPYSLMTIDNVPDLSSWIEHCAGVWAAS